MIVETESAVYTLDMAAMKLKRTPRDAPIEVEKPRDGLPAAVVDLRKDGEAIPFQFLAPLEIGKPAQFLLEIRNDGVHTIRTTTDVLRIYGAEE
jgi:hypothetical protein